MYRREKFAQKTSTKNLVQFDSNVTYLPNDNELNQSNINNQSKQANKPTDLSRISYSLDSPVNKKDNLAPFDKLINKSIENADRNNRSNLFSNDNWQTSNIDFRSALSGAEMRNLDLLQLLNDQNVRNWLTETIYPDHVRVI